MARRERRTNPSQNRAMRLTPVLWYLLMLFVSMVLLYPVTGAPPVW